MKKIIIGLLSVILLIFVVYGFPRYKDTTIKINGRSYTSVYDKWTGNYYYKMGNAHKIYNPTTGYEDVIKYN